MSRFLGSLRARLMLLHPSPNCSLRAESLVHVHFKEEIGIAELIPLVTTYIILFAYIYFSTRRSSAEAQGFLQAKWAFHTTCFPASGGGLGRDDKHAQWSQKPGLHPPIVLGLGGSRPSLASPEKTLSRLGFPKDTLLL